MVAIVLIMQTPVGYQTDFKVKSLWLISSSLCWKQIISRYSILQLLQNIIKITTKIYCNAFQNIIELYRYCIVHIMHISL